MSLAKRVGLNVADAQYIEIGDKPCILVERYDRVSDKQSIRKRIHQEDFCQALGYPPEKKYQAEGGPLLRDCIALLREWSTIPVLDIRAFIDALIFNAIIGNTDAHGKNFSMLYSGRERRLSPLYDLICTLAWDELSKTMSMKIGKCKHINALTNDHWKKMAEETNLGFPMIHNRISELATTIQDQSTATGNDLPKVVTPMTEKVIDIVTIRAKNIKL
jgi:serine/threonine-protein kinase HipA